MSVSKPKTTTSQASQVNTTNLNVQDNEGVTVVGDSNQITTTDFGALEIAGELGASAFEFGSDGFTAVDRSSGRVLDAAELAIDRNSDLTRDSLEFGGGVLERASDFARGIFTDALEQSSNVLKEGQAQLGNTVTNLNAIARQQSTSDAERVQDLATKVLIAGAAMVGLVVLAGALKSRAA